jgi:hypothetical protein
MAEINSENDSNFDSAFQAITVEITLTNTTTRTTVKESTTIKLVEIAEQGIALEVPPRTCAQGHNLLFELKLVKPGATKPFALKATGKVSEVESLDGADRADVVLIQFDEKEWEQVLSAFMSRQSEIEEFLKAARGY